MLLQCCNIFARYGFARCCPLTLSGGLFAIESLPVQVLQDACTEQHVNCHIVKQNSQQFIGVCNAEEIVHTARKCATVFVVSFTDNFLGAWHCPEALLTTVEISKLHITMFPPPL